MKIFLNFQSKIYFILFVKEGRHIPVVHVFHEKLSLDLKLFFFVIFQRGINLNPSAHHKFISFFSW